MKFPIHRDGGITRDGQLVGMITGRDVVIFLANRTRN